jgi:hypothetical protein
VTQQHKNGDTSPDRVANGDIVERLRKWFKDVNAVSAIDLMDEAANEIERLRNGAAECCETVPLTNEEREALIWCVELLDELESSKGDALRSLLERLK